MKIVVAPNAFKGSLTATEAAIAMEAGIRGILPDAEVVQVPVADGGDGLVDVAVEALNGEMCSLIVTGPRNSPVEANYCYVKANMPGAGAAGGLGAGLHAFLGAKLCKGIDLIFELVGLAEKLSGADLALTGEGQIDFQTVFGKAPGGVGAAAKAQGIPCFAIAGSIGKELGDLHESGINAVFSLCPGPMTLDESMKRSKENVSRVTEQAIRAFLAGRKQ